MAKHSMIIGDKTVELKKIELSLVNSQETYCYSAQVWVNGKLVAETRNDGWGGPDMVDMKAEGYTSDQIESLAGEVMDDWQQAQETKKVNRQMAKRCQTHVITRAPGSQMGAYTEYRKVYTPLWAEGLKNHVAGVIILNELLANNPNMDVRAWLCEPVK